MFTQFIEHGDVKQGEFSLVCYNIFTMGSYSTHHQKRNINTKLLTDHIKLSQWCITCKIC